MWGRTQQSEKNQQLISLRGLSMNPDSHCISWGWRHWLRRFSKIFVWIMIRSILLWWNVETNGSQTLINYISRFDDDICFWVNLGNLKNIFLQNPYSKSMLTYKLFCRICLYFFLHFEIKMTTKFLKWLFWARFFYWTIKQFNYSFFSHWESFNLVFG